MEDKELWPTGYNLQKTYPVQLSQGTILTNSSTGVRAMQPQGEETSITLARGGLRDYPPPPAPELQDAAYALLAHLYQCQKVS